MPLAFGAFAAATKQIVRLVGRPFRAAMLVAILGLCGCIPRIVADGQIRPEPFEDLLSRTEAVRGITLEDEIDARVVSREALGETVRRAAFDQWKPAELRAYETSLVTMGLWPGDLDLLDEFVASLSVEAGGLYLPEERALYVVEDPEVPFSLTLLSTLARRDLVRESLLSHELVHALQHQAYPGLFDRLAVLKSQDDVVLSIQAAIEGDAVRYAFAAVISEDRLPAPVALREEVESKAERGTLAEFPSLLRYSVTFPYTFGYPLSYLEGTLLLERPPASTEQVMHTSKRQEAFRSIDFGELQAKLPGGCESVYENTMGEFTMSILFRDLAGEPEPRWWNGWDGDRYLVARCNGDPAFLWYTAWDSEADAVEFQDGYSNIADAVARRAGLTANPQAKRDRRVVLIWTSTLSSLADAVPDSIRTHRITTVPELDEFLADSPPSGS